MQERVNGRIKADRVRVIVEDGVDLGVFSIGDALDLARSRREDLVEVQPDSIPPVCEIVDYGRYRFRLQEARKARMHE
jgi:translation initiation factor IF-3